MGSLNAALRAEPTQHDQDQDKTSQPINPMAWAVLETDCDDGSKELHVVPVNDIKEHVPDDCWCGTYNAEGEDNLIVIHPSGDKREHTYEKGWVH